MLQIPQFSSSPQFHLRWVTNSSLLTSFLTFYFSCTVFVVLLVGTFDLTLVVFVIIANCIFKPFIFGVAMMGGHWRETGIKVVIIWHSSSLCVGVAGGIGKTWGFFLNKCWWCSRKTVRLEILKINCC